MFYYLFYTGLLLVLLQIFQVLQDVQINKLLFCNAQELQTASMDDKSRVEVEIFVRSMCPACSWFIMNPLLKLVKNDDFAKIIDLKMYPVAAMQELNTEDDGFECSGGASECYGNKALACVMDLEKSNMKAVRFIACLEDGSSGSSWILRLQKCLPVSMLPNVKTCIRSQSKEIIKRMIQRDMLFNYEDVPHIVVQGRPLFQEKDLTPDLKNLKLAICKAFEGDRKLRPSDCGPDKIELKVVWRAFCPACKWFFNEVIPVVLNDKSFQKIVNFISIPAAGMSIDSDNQISCTSGPKECDGHRYLACAIKEIEDTTKQVNTIKCLEGSSSWEKKEEACFSNEIKPKIKECIANNADDFLKEHIKQVNQLNVQWMPHILVNGNLIGSATQGVSLEELKKNLCDAYTGFKQDLPKYCVDLESQIGYKSKSNTDIISVKISDKEDTDGTSIGNEKNVSSSEKAAKPCKKSSPGVVYDDPPDIGSRKSLSDDSDASTEFNRPKSLTMLANLGYESMVLSFLGFFMMIVVILYLLRPHKKRV